MAPPNTYANKSTNRIGWMVTSISVSGSRAILARLRLASTAMSLTSQRKLPSRVTARRGACEMVTVVMPLYLPAVRYLLPVRHRRRPVRMAGRRAGARSR